MEQHKTRIAIHRMGKLRIYLRAKDKVSPDGLWKKMFPVSTYRHVITEAKKAGITNASAFPTHMGYTKDSRVQQATLESGNSHMTLCVELIDERDRLERFFLTHKHLFRDKLVVYKEVEFWEY
ncbi:MAG: DUF190 domain-containing protein [Flavobacteriales bacterium]